MALSVVFDDPSHTYHPGQSVVGRLVVKPSNTVQCRGIFVQCLGEGNVKWTVSGGRGSSITYKASEKYFESIVQVSGERELEPGAHNFPFNFELPKNIPSSTEELDGNIKYAIQVKLDVLQKSAQTVRTGFTVINPVDLNLIPNAKEAAQVQVSKNFCCLCCRSGLLELSVKIPSSGYVSGEVIPLRIEIENNSNELIFPVKCELQKAVTCQAFRLLAKKKTEYYVIARVAVAEKVNPHSSMQFRRDIKVPFLPRPIPNLDNCKIINIVYALIVS